MFNTNENILDSDYSNSSSENDYDNDDDEDSQSASQSDISSNSSSQKTQKSEIKQMKSKKQSKMLKSIKQNHENQLVDREEQEVHKNQAQQQSDTQSQNLVYDNQDIHKSQAKYSQVKSNSLKTADNENSLVKQESSSISRQGSNKVQSDKQFKQPKELGLENINLGDKYDKILDEDAFQQIQEPNSKKGLDKKQNINQDVILADNDQLVNRPRQNSSNKNNYPSNKKSISGVKRQSHQSSPKLDHHKGGRFDQKNSIKNMNQFVLDKNSQQKMIDQRSSIEQMILQGIISSNLISQANRLSHQFNKNQVQGSLSNIQEIFEKSLNKSINDIRKLSCINDTQKTSHNISSKDAGSLKVPKASIIETLKIVENISNTQKALEPNNDQSIQEKNQTQTDCKSLQAQEEEKLVDRFSRLLQNSQIPLLLQYASGMSFRDTTTLNPANSMDYFDRISFFKKFFPHNNFDQIMSKLKNIQQEFKRQKKRKITQKVRRQNIVMYQTRFSVIQGTSNAIKTIPKDVNIDSYKPTYLSYGVSMQKGHSKHLEEDNNDCQQSYNDKIDRSCQRYLFEIKRQQLEQGHQGDQDVSDTSSFDGYNVSIQDIKGQETIRQLQTELPISEKRNSGGEIFPCSLTNSKRINSKVDMSSNYGSQQIIKNKEDGEIDPQEISFFRENIENQEATNTKCNSMQLQQNQQNISINKNIQIDPSKQKINGKCSRDKSQSIKQLMKNEGQIQIHEKRVDNLNRATTNAVNKGQQKAIMAEQKYEQNFQKAAICWYFIGIQEIVNNYPTNWLDKIGISQQHYYEKYIYSIYWSITTMTTVGYGDIVATNSIEALFIAIIMILFSCVFAYSINNIGFILQEIEKSSKQLNDNITTIQSSQLRKNIEYCQILKENLENLNTEIYFMFNTEENLNSSEFTSSESEEEEEIYKEDESMAQSQKTDKKSESQSQSYIFTKKKTYKGDKNNPQQLNANNFFNENDQNQEINHNNKPNTQNRLQQDTNKKKIQYSQNKLTSIELKESQTNNLVSEYSNSNLTSNNYTQQEKEQQLPSMRGSEYLNQNIIEIQQVQNNENLEQNTYSPGQSKNLKNQIQKKRRVSSNYLYQFNINKTANKAADENSLENKNQDFQKQPTLQEKMSQAINQYQQSYNNSKRLLSQNSTKTINFDNNEYRCSIDQMLLQGMIANTVLQAHRQSLMQKKYSAPQNIIQEIIERNQNSRSRNEFCEGENNPNKKIGSSKSITDHREEKSFNNLSNLNPVSMNNSSNINSNNQNNNNNNGSSNNNTSNIKKLNENNQMIEDMQFVERISRLMQTNQLPMLFQYTSGLSLKELQTMGNSNSMDFFDKMCNFKKFFPKNNFEKVINKLRFLQQEQKRNKKKRLSQKSRRQNFIFPANQPVTSNRNIHSGKLKSDHYAEQYKPTNLSYGVGTRNGVVFPKNKFQIE
ncbi:hypothetical protein ABPG74_007280 [Tetrahymena malaccensis]